MVHEAGHALGLSNYEGVDFVTGTVHDDTDAHATVIDSVMNYLQEHDCSPNPLDIMAMHALYQAVGR